MPKYISIDEKNKLNPSEVSGTELRSGGDESLLQIRNTQLENALNEIEDLYQNAPCGYHSLDANGLIIRMNDTELRWLGYTREEVVGKKRLIELTSEAGTEIFYQTFEKFKKDGKVTNLEFEMCRKDGTKYPVLLNSEAIYDEKGNYLMNRSVVFDLTERKKFEHEIRSANEELKRINEEKNRFIGIAAHDLQNPIQLIILAAEEVKRKAKILGIDNTPATDEIVKISLHMSQIVKHLLNVNRIESGGLKLVIESTEVNYLTDLSVHLFEPIAKAKRIDLFYDYPFEKLHCQLDRSCFVQILDNLISNAIKFTPSEKMVFVRLMKDEANVIVEVEDEGQGILPEELPFIFNRFQKLSPKPTAGEPSIGLGLSIVKEFTQMMGGKIEVESTINEGTKFRLSFPRI
ncbi:MAG: ATP-binding protein [Spirosomataceae bacterium]